ncbi:arabinan endo-1,5-alpha-L-arabinosidase [Silvibacterium dinghuense]|uniref:Arabinan endo-1,5-alpha-L-arabinosidase n=1 Tax=Silvibacterium dinghuense TaxID=1560006 RepID=A0A4V1NUT6_9BACT|nr:arabinan endo-1,5-alpha-L-arabinosidase [Silvibacterium dinghuense]RXS93368.1 arabinan endo-1,5-alpha-L-arabinosidase [Silvibacterium dinghuense]GGH05266.1 arabinan endo-1,5-alpha-L-arabinosidase [Silvibacterium dinghuense]
MKPLRLALKTLAATALALLPALGAAQAPQAFPLSGDYWGTHDPSIMKAPNSQGKDTWYVFATGKAFGGGQFQIRCSNDLHAWKLCGHVFDQIPEWIRKDSPGTEELWAPDISFHHGEYQLYYAYSLFGKNLSGIALATNKTLDPASPDYKWEDHGLVLRSVKGDDFNAIDPNFIVDAHGNSWLAFGSFWNGIKMRRIDNKTGLLSKTDTRLYALATRAKPADAVAAEKRVHVNGVTDDLPPDWEAIEAPFVVHHGGYYYLFVSWDLCCRGTKSTYHTMVGRSRSVTGPYVDKTGKPMMEGGGSELLNANARWLGPGGASLLMSGGDGIIVFHAYDAKTGKPALQVSTLTWQDDWPHAALGDSEAAPPAHE